MSDKSTVRQQIEKNGLLLIAVAMVVIYWVLDSLTSDQVFARTLIAFFVLAYGLFTQSLINSRREALEEKERTQQRLIQTESIAAIGQLVAGIAHELNNPLTVIIGYAELLEVTTSVALPDSFLGPVRVWPRVGGTTTVRGGWLLPYFVPWAEVAEWTPPGTSLPGAARSFTLRGYLYRIATADCPGCPEDGYVPLPPTQMRFGFTVLGRVDRPPTVALLAPAAGDTLAPGDTLTVRWAATDPDEVTTVELDLVQGGRPPLALARMAAGAGAAGVTVPCGAWPGGGALRVTAYDDHGTQRDQASADVAVRIRAAACNGGAGATLSAAPNPFRGAIRILGRAGTRVAIFDLSGRRRRVAVLDGGGAFAWDGRDDSGRAVAPGLYFVRAGGAARLTKLVRIE